MSRAASPSLAVLLVEDSESDAKIAQNAFKRAKDILPLSHVRNGREALDYLNRRGPYCEAPENPSPDIILMDVRMPAMDGLETLRELKADPRLKALPVIMLATSDNAEDVAKSYEYGAAGYILKPATLEDFVKFVDSLNAYWGRVNTLPPRP